MPEYDVTQVNTSDVPPDYDGSIFVLFVALRIKRLVQTGRLASAAHALFVAERVGYNVREINAIVRKDLGLRERSAR